MWLEAKQYECLVNILSAFVASARLRGRHESFLLFLLSAGATLLDPPVGVRPAFAFQSRALSDDGTALGALIIPVLTAAISSDSFFLHVSLSLCSSQLLALSVSVFCQATLCHAPLDDDGKDTTLDRPQGKSVLALAASISATVLLACGPWRLAVLSVSLAGPLFLWACNHLLPHTFSLGEALLVTQALVLSGLHATRASEAISRLVIWLPLASILGAALLIPLIHASRFLHGQWVSPAAAQKVMAARIALGIAVWCVVLLAAHPALWTLRFAFGTGQRVACMVYWIAVLGGGLVAMAKIGSLDSVPQIIVRKGYHIIALLLFLPPLLVEPQLLAIALAVAFAMLLAVETVRVGGVPVISQRLTGFMTTFTDARDGGVIFVTHLALLTGMAGPIWISVLGKKEGQPISGTTLAGLLILGIGDTFASVVGRLWGRHRIAHGSPKSMEGLAAGAATTMVAWTACTMLSNLLGATAIAMPPLSVGLIAATVLSSLLESVTAQLDNAVLPLHYVAMLSCLTA